MKLHVVSGYAIRVAFSFFSQCCVTEESPSTTKKGASDLAIVLDVFEGKPELQIFNSLSVTLVVLRIRKKKSIIY